MHVGLPHLQRQPLGKRRAQRKLVEPAAVHTWNRNNAAFATGGDRLTQRVWSIGGQVDARFRPVVPRVERRAMRLQPDRIDARIRSLTSGQFTQRVRNIDVFVVEDVGLAMRGSEGKAIWKSIDGNDFLGAEQVGASDRKLPYRSAAPHSDRVARLDLTVLRRHVTGREDVRQEKDLLVRQ